MKPSKDIPIRPGTDDAAWADYRAANPARKPRVYLSGPMNGRSDAEVHEWRDWFKQCDMFEWVDPSERDIRGKEHDAELALKIANEDYELVESCQALVVNTTMGPGWGTAGETHWAWLAEMPVIAICKGTPSPHIRRWATEICVTKEVALQKLKEAFA